MTKRRLPKNVTVNSERRTRDFLKKTAMITGRDQTIRLHRIMMHDKHHVVYASIMRKVWWSLYQNQPEAQVSKLIDNLWMPPMTKFMIQQKGKMSWCIKLQSWTVRIHDTPSWFSRFGSLWLNASLTITFLDDWWDRKEILSPAVICMNQFWEKNAATFLFAYRKDERKCVPFIFFFDRRKELHM